MQPARGHHETYSHFNALLDLADGVSRELYNEKKGPRTPHQDIDKRRRTQEPRTGWNRGEPQKPPAVWAPPPGNARPEGRKETREEPRRGAGEGSGEGVLLVTAA